MEGLCKGKRKCKMALPIDAVVCSKLEEKSLNKAYSEFLKMEAYPIAGTYLVVLGTSL